MAVYVVHPIRDNTDLASAMVYGDLVYVNHRYIYADQIDNEQMPPAFIRKMEEAVHRFEPKNDYLLIAGDHLQLVAMSVLLGREWKRFKVLRYDRMAKGYYVVEIGGEG